MSDLIYFFDTVTVRAFTLAEKDIFIMYGFIRRVEKLTPSKIIYGTYNEYQRAFTNTYTMGRYSQQKVLFIYN